MSGLAGLGFSIVESDTPEVSTTVDAVLLDCGVIDDEVLDFCRRLRKATQVPIIVMTQRADLDAWLRGHDLGIDDYAVQPCGLEELAARLRLAVVPAREQPLPPGPPRRLIAGPLVISEDSYTVSVHGDRIDLRPKEYQLLVALMRQLGRAVPREDLIAHLWPAGADGAERSLEVHMASLRGKLALPGMISTVRGVGYRMVTPESFLRLTG